MTGLQDKVALVTGGSSGIGQAIAIGLGEEGASVAISYVGGPEGAKTRRRAMTRLNVTDTRCAALFASGLQRSDTPDAEMVAEVISRAVRQFGTRVRPGQRPARRLTGVSVTTGPSAPLERPVS